MKKAIAAAKSTFAILPGLAIIATQIGTPPGLSSVLLGGIIEACGVFTLIVLQRRESSLKAIAPRKLERLAIVMFSLFFVCLLAYILLFTLQVIYDDKNNETFLFPFFTSDNLHYMIQQAGSKANAIKQYGPQAIRDSINDAPVLLAITKIIFVVVYVCIFEFLTVGFGLIAAKSSRRSIRNGQPPATTPKTTEPNIIQ